MTKSNSNIPNLDIQNLRQQQNPSSHCLIIVDDNRDYILSQLTTLLNLNIIAIEDIKVFWLNSKISAEDKRALLTDQTLPSDIGLSGFENIADLITELKGFADRGQKVHMLLDMEMPANDLSGRTFRTSGACILELIIKDESLRQAMKSDLLAITITSSNSIKDVFDGNEVIMLDDDPVEIVIDETKKQMELRYKADKSIIKVNKAHESKLGTQSRAILAKFLKSFEDANPDSLGDNAKKYPHMLQLAKFIKEIGHRYRSNSVESDASTTRHSFVTSSVPVVSEAASLVSQTQDNATTMR